MEPLQHLDLLINQSFGLVFLIFVFIYIYKYLKIHQVNITKRTKKTKRKTQERHQSVSKE